MTGSFIQTAGSLIPPPPRINQDTRVFPSNKLSSKKWKRRWVTNETPNPHRASFIHYLCRNGITGPYIQTAGSLISPQNNRDMRLFASNKLSSKKRKLRWVANATPKPHRASFTHYSCKIGMIGFFMKTARSLIICINIINIIFSEITGTWGCLVLLSCLQKAEAEVSNKMKLPAHTRYFVQDWQWLVCPISQAGSLAGGRTEANKQAFGRRRRILIFYNRGQGRGWDAVGISEEGGESGIDRQVPQGSM